MRATVAELADPRYDAPMRALATEIVHDPALHASGASGSTGRCAPQEGAAAQRQAAGRAPGELDIALAIDLIWGPVFHRWLQSGGPLTEEFADQVVASAMHGLRG